MVPVQAPAPSHPRDAMWLITCDMWSMTLYIRPHHLILRSLGEIIEETP